MSCSLAFWCSRSVCSFGIGMASFSMSSLAVSKTGAECANSGKTIRRTGRKGAAPATAESIIERMRSVFARIARRSSGFAKSVWQAATEYLMCSMRFVFSAISAYLGVLCVMFSAIQFDAEDTEVRRGTQRNSYQSKNSDTMDGTGDVTTRVLYFSMYLRRFSVIG